MNKVTLYQYDSKGNVKLWSMEVINNGTSSTMLSHSGLLNGKHTPDETIITEGKNQGKSNETNHYTQAVMDAQSKITKQIKKGYVEDITQIKASSELGSGTPSPMLAQKYDPTGKQSSSKTLAQIGILGKTIYVQRKKDGLRDNITVNKHGVTMRSRKGEIVPLLPHIVAAITLPTDDTEFTLDGELFPARDPETGLFVFTFNYLNGLVRDAEKTPEREEEAKQIRFHLYDTFSSEGYEVRRLFLNQFAKEGAIIVEESYEIIATDENIKEYMDKFLEEGEEGLMIRVPGIPYQHKRSWSLIKCKLFEDKEFTIVGMEESVKGGMVGAIVVAMDCITHNRKGELIETFRAGLKMSHGEAKEMWENQSKYIGKQATIEFFGVSEYKIPRFPKFKGIRND